MLQRRVQRSGFLVSHQCQPARLIRSIRYAHANRCVDCGTNGFGCGGGSPSARVCNGYVEVEEASGEEHCRPCPSGFTCDGITDVRVCAPGKYIKYSGNAQAMHLSMLNGGNGNARKRFSYPSTFQKVGKLDFERADSA